MKLPRHLPRRVCSSLFLLGLALTFLNACHLLAAPWWLVVLPFLTLAAGFLGLFIFVLVGAFLVEWRSARARKRNRQRRTYQFDP